MDQPPLDSPREADEPAPAQSAAPRRLRRRIFGVNPAQALDLLARADAERASLQQQVDRLREGIERLEAQVARQDAELAMWRARRADVEAEIQHARDRAREVETEAHARAERAEEHARERALALVDRASAEASGIIETARNEARALASRENETAIQARERVERLTVLHHEMSQSVRAAMQQFERALFELGRTGPAHQLAAERFDDAPAPAQPSTGGALRLVDGASEEQDPQAAVSATASARHVPGPVTVPPVSASPDDTFSPTQLSIELYPVHDFPVLTEFERSVADLDPVLDVHVLSLDGGVAQLQLQLERPAPIARLIRQHIEARLEIDDRRPDHLRVRLLEDGRASAG